MRRAGAATLLGLAVAALAAGAVAIRSYDFGWHLRAGEWILEQGGRPPTTDPLAFTSAGRPWTDHEWLFQVLLAGLLKAGGLAAAWGLKEAAVLAAILGPAAWLLRRGRPPGLVLALGLLALAGARFRFFVRPELAALVLVPVTLLLLSDAGRRSAAGRDPRPALWPLPILVAVWVNLHPSALLGSGLVGTYGLVLLLRRRPAAPFLLAAGACGAALLANPYGARVLATPLAIAGALRSPEIVNPEWGTSLRAEFWLFWLSLLCLTAVVALGARRGWRLDAPLLACGAVLAAAAALALRQVGTFFVALPVIGAAGISPPAAVRDTRRRDRPLLLLLAGLLAGGWFVMRPQGGPLGPRLAPGRFPEAMALTYREAGLSGPFYNPVRFGGYLAWKLAPERVFLDGRNEVHAPLLAEIAACRRAPDPTCWDRILDRWDVQAAFVDYDSRRVPVGMPDGATESRTLTSVYFRRSRWALVDWDDTALLYVRRGGPNHRRPALPEDRVLVPEDPEWFAAGLAAGTVDPEAALAELARRRARHPESRRAAVLEDLARKALAERRAPPLESGR